MFDTPLTPPTVDQAAIDHFVARGNRLRSRAFTDLFKVLFSASNAGHTTPDLEPSGAV